MIGIIDYGMGNLHSVQSACSHLQLESVVSSDPNVLAGCDILILPGVGAFGDMEHMLKSSGLFAWLKEQVNVQKKPLLGICLGMQALFEVSYEFGEYEGFGFLKGKVRAMEPLLYTVAGKPAKLTVPQIGWNQLFFSSDFALEQELEADPYVYFDHTYLVQDWDPAALMAYAQYGPYVVPAICLKDNVMGTQFHPEKSGETGLAILAWFGKEFGNASASGH